MAENSFFWDSSALVSGVMSSEGAARVLLLLAEAEKIKAIISHQVVIEVERTIAEKAPEAIPYFRSILKSAHFILVADPPVSLVKRNLSLISHAADVPILLAAIGSGAKYLITLNRKHFMDDPQVAKKTGLQIGSPGDALAWIRKQLIS